MRRLRLAVRYRIHREDDTAPTIHPGRMEAHRNTRELGDHRAAYGLAVPLQLLLGKERNNDTLQALQAH